MLARAGTLVCIISVMIAIAVANQSMVTAKMLLAASEPPMPLPDHLENYSVLNGALASNVVTNTVTVRETMLFEYVGNLETARYRHTSTLLNDGRVLIVGGRDANHQILSSSELFSTTVNEWSPAGDMNSGREGHTSTLLLDGRVLVLGGSNNSGDLAKADFFDPMTDSWLGGGDLLVGPRSFHTATRLPDGTVLVAGGRRDGSYPTGTELLDPVAGTRRDWPTLNEGRAFHTAILLTDGRPLLFGGVRESSYLGSHEFYYPYDHRWLIGSGEGGAGGQDHTLTLLSDGRVLASGGKISSSQYGMSNGAGLFDYQTNTWAATGKMEASRTGHTATLLPNGKVVVIGGNSGSGPLSSVEIYTPASGTWAAAGSLNIGRTLHTATLLPDGRVLVAGGETGAAAGDRAEIGAYAPANVFTATLTLPSDWMADATASVSFVGTTESADLASASLSDDGIAWGDWIPVAGGVRITITWQFGSDGLDKPVYLRLRDVMGQQATVVTGTVDLDTEPPSSSLTSLPSTSMNPIRLAWLGSDNLSGIASYDVQVRDGESGEWSSVLAGTSATQGEFIGEVGKTYFFRIRARDIADNVEAWPDTYDTLTSVVAPTSTPTATATPTGTPSPSITPSATPTATATVTSSETPTATPDEPQPVFLPIVMSEPSPTPTSSPTSTPTRTPTNTRTNTPSPTATRTPMPTSTPTRVPPTSTPTSSQGDPTLTPTPSPAPWPSGDNVRCDQYGGIQICAWVSDGAPAVLSDVTAYVRFYADAKPVSGISVHTTWHFNSSLVAQDCMTGGDGIARCTRNIGFAIPGYKVTVDAAVHVVNGSYYTSTWFTPK